MKIMFRVFYLRIITKINAAQSVDQAGFIKVASCDDHLIACAILIEKLWRAKKQLWVCAVDFKKAFDSVEFSSIGKHVKSAMSKDHTSSSYRSCTRTKRK